MNNIRLPTKSVDAIKQAFTETFRSNDHLWIFGSRVNLDSRGGDIDLYIETTEIDIDKAIELKSKFVSKVWRLIGEQKIDIVLNILNLNNDQDIYRIAKADGVKLI